MMRSRRQTATIATTTALLAACNAAEYSKMDSIGMSPITSVSLHRSACEGVCPVYTVNIYGGGQVDYEGVEFVRIKGREQSHVSQGRLAMLAEAIEQARFFNLRDQYTHEEDGCEEILTDFPRIEIVATRSGVQEKISYDAGCVGVSAGHDIERLANTIDAVADSERWVGTHPASLPNSAPR